ncbi:hypothetical protein J1N35_014616 [Gossypium stocksii]|uniref:SWIM-type domain-containing protein n=1 Tax=Gossypium stocksii TaxID=47602 RepID=A0A9D3VV51_9ROSI|nr:hypothetical protein J1N35_014616 [Gossypium stocksii]
MHTMCHDRDNLGFRVIEFDRLHEGIIGGQYAVYLRNRTCNCGRFDVLRYPCAHVIAACQNLRIDPMSYVDEVYRLETMYNVWRHVFPPVPDKQLVPHGVISRSVLDSSLVRLPTEVVVPPAGDLVVGVERLTHLDRIMNATVFASPMEEVFEPRKVMEIGRKKSSLMAPRAIPHAMTAYRLAVDSE